MRLIRFSGHFPVSHQALFQASPPRPRAATFSMSPPLFAVFTPRRRCFYIIIYYDLWLSV